MTRHKVARGLTGLSAAGFFIAAMLHTSGYQPVTALAQQGPSGLGGLVSALWLAFSAAMITLGLIVAILVRGQVGAARAILILAGCFPLATAALQLRFLGFIPPVAILGTIALVSFAGAVASPRSPDLTSGGAA
jgi:hypothetical protein